MESNQTQVANTIVHVGLLWVRPEIMERKHDTRSIKTPNYYFNALIRNALAHTVQNRKCQMLQVNTSKYIAPNPN